MRKISFLAVAATVLLSASPVFAEKTDEKKSDGDRKICKPEQNSVTRIPRKICKTKAEWDQLNKASVADSAFGGR